MRSMLKGALVKFLPHQRMLVSNLTPSLYELRHHLSGRGIVALLFLSQNA